MMSRLARGERTTVSRSDTSGGEASFDGDLGHELLGGTLDAQTSVQLSNARVESLAKHAPLLFFKGVADDLRDTRALARAHALLGESPEILAERGARRLHVAAVRLGHPALDQCEPSLVEAERVILAAREHDDLRPFGERAIELDATSPDTASYGVHWVRIALRGDPTGHGVGHGGRAEGVPGRGP
jgi:hypothetical protein